MFLIYLKNNINKIDSISNKIYFTLIKIQYNLIKMLYYIICFKNTLEKDFFLKSYQFQDHLHIHVAIF